MRQIPRSLYLQWLEEWLPGGHQSFSHELPHLGACSVGCLHPNFHSCKGSETKCRTVARAQACEDASGSDCKWISAFHPPGENGKSQHSCTTCGMTKGSLDTRAEAQPCE